MVFRAAEFFAGIGLVRAALGRHGIDVVWANDIEPVKAAIYAANFPAEDYVLGDVRDVHGKDLPPVDLATASFPCTDLSLAGHRRGLKGEQSGLFWEFARILQQMPQRPHAILLENVPGLATSHGGRDLDAVLARLDDVGYRTQTVHLDARSFVPQSRPRLFVVAVQDGLAAAPPPPPNPPPPAADLTLKDVVDHDADGWWDEARTARFLAELAPLHAARLARLQHQDTTTYRAAYRRTRNGRSTWEIRNDEIAGCLRTARGGSSKQAIVQAGHGHAKARWMTPREYARLQGVDDSFDFAGLSSNKVLFGFGDAVCVPAVAWIAEHYLVPALRRRNSPRFSGVGTTRANAPAEATSQNVPWTTVPADHAAPAPAPAAPAPASAAATTS